MDKKFLMQLKTIMQEVKGWMQHIPFVGLSQ